MGSKRGAARALLLLVVAIALYAPVFDATFCTTTTSCSPGIGSYAAVGAPDHAMNRIHYAIALLGPAVRTTPSASSSARRASIQRAPTRFACSQRRGESRRRVPVQRGRLS